MQAIEANPEAARDGGRHLDTSGHSPRALATTLAQRLESRPLGEMERVMGIEPTTFSLGS